MRLWVKRGGQSHMAGEELRSRAQRDIIKRAITNAFWSWESAVIIALTILVTALNLQPFLWWQQWFWIVAGVIAELVLIGVSITDPKVQREAVEQLFRERINPGEIKNLRSRERLDKALEYRARMEELAQSQEGALRLNLRAAADEMDKGIQLMYTLGKRLDAYLGNELLQRDKQTVPKALQALETRLEHERDPRVREELAQAVETKRAQQAHLEQLENTMKRADIQIDNMLAAMGTLYAQMQLIDARDLDSGRAQRLRQDVADQVLEMQDTIDAMDEVYSESAAR